MTTENQFLYVESLIDQVNKRQDSHSSRMDAGFEKIFEKLDTLTEAKHKEHSGFSERLTRLESEKNVWGKIIQPILAIFAGALGGWLSKH